MALLLREEDVRRLLTMPDTVAVLEQAFGAMADECVVNLPRNRIMLANGVLNILAAAAPTLGTLGYKTYTAFREGVRWHPRVDHALSHPCGEGRHARRGACAGRADQADHHQKPAAAKAVGSDRTGWAASGYH